MEPGVLFYVMVIHKHNRICYDGEELGKGKSMLVRSRFLKNVQVGVALLVSIVLVAVSQSFAAHAEGNANVLKVSPLRTDIQVKPGESGKVSITVTNLTENDILVRPYENDFISGDENGTPSIILDESQYAPTHSLKRFMAPLSVVKVPANGSTTVDVVINVPTTTQAGGYFGAIRFAPASPDGGGQVNTSASVASLILLTVPGDAVEKLNISDFSILQGDKAATDFRTPNDLKVSFRFENKGNVQLGPFGKVSVTKGKAVVYEADFNNKNPRDVILPDGARRWDMPLENIGSFGHYTVSATFTYGTKNESIDISRSFWVIPTAVIVAALAVLVLIVGAIIWLIFFLRSRRSRKLRRQSTGRLR